MISVFSSRRVWETFLRIEVEMEIPVWHVTNMYDITTAIRQRYNKQTR